MDNSWQRIQKPFLWLFECLLVLYPSRFRSEFYDEIRAILLKRMREAEDHGMLVWFTTAFQEFKGLIRSILGERWHELWARKEKVMLSEDQLRKDAGAEGGGIAVLQPAGTPDVRWFIGWTLLTTAAIPAALLTMTPLAAMLLWLIDRGVNAGLWTGLQPSALGVLCFVISLALALASAQWILLRRFLPRAELWFIATGAGLLLGGLAIGLALWKVFPQSGDPFWIMAAALLPFGLILGLAQWLYLRRFLPNAFWIIFIDVLAAGSILLAGPTSTSYAEFLVLVFPGLITGTGLWLLLKQSRLKIAPNVQTQTSRGKSRNFKRLALLGIGVVAFIPLFFACSWVYAASQLAMAKNDGTYPSVEEAIIANNSQGWGGAKVIRLENIHAGPNRPDDQSHVWFGGATVYLDRVPKGHTLSYYTSGSYYLHVREGWVFMPEGAFPEFVGWVMELYHMEGVQ